MKGPDAATVKHAANGRWESILLDLGVADYLLNNKNQPCPSCAGTDRWQYTNYKGDGMYNCRGCGSGDGFALLMMVHGWDFPEALKKVAECIGVSRMDTEMPAQNNKYASVIKSKIKALTGSDPASLYLKSRKIYSKSLSPADIGFIALQKYYNKDRKPAGEYPVMVSTIRDSLGEAITYQLTYLTDKGEKAPVESGKKLVSSVNGRPVGIYPYGFDKMCKYEAGVTEGLEDCLSASMKYKIPVIGVAGTALLESFIPNDNIKFLTVFIQNDEGFQGQAASFKLLKTLADKTEINLDWIISDKGDFNDDWVSTSS